MNLDIVNLIAFLFKNKLKIIIITLIFFTSSCFYALHQENIYQASGLYKEAELVDAKPKINTGGLSGLAALTGITSDSSNKMPEAIEILNSHVFLIDFIKKNEYQDEVFAASELLPDNSLLFKPHIYNKNQNEWVEGVISDKDLYKRISSDLYISQDRITGFTRVTYRHISPYFAKEFLDNLILELDNQMRVSDLEEYKRAMIYLGIKLENEIVQNQKDLITGLIRSYLQKETIASISDEYVLKAIDPPFINLQKIGPNRKLIVIAFTLLGFGISIFLSFAISFYRENWRSK